MRNKYLNGVLPMLLINFSIGSVYCWTLFKEYVLEYTGFESWVTEWCFSLAIFFLGMTAAFGGKIVERSVKLSSWLTWVTFTTGWLLTGFGIQIKNPLVTILGFGVIQGIGLGFGYLTPVKTLMIWFDKRKGFAAGLAITGFGLAGVIANPIIAVFLEKVVIYKVFYILAGIYSIAILLAALLIYRPKLDILQVVELNKVRARIYIFTKQFSLLWFVLFINISCGLALISQEKQIYDILGVSSLDWVVLFCSINAVGNLLGRLSMASLQDRLDYKYIPYYLMAALSIFACFGLLLGLGSVGITVFMLFIIQFFFGCGFSCLPNILHQQYGMKQLATVHGFMLSSWAVAGLFGNQLSAFIMLNYNLSVLYIVLGMMFVIELILLISWIQCINKVID